jgi:LAO/AO transport system kinase
LTNSPTTRSKRPSLADLASGLRAGRRASLARAITLVESVARADRARANRLLQEVLPHTGAARRIGITGAPGVGKSTLIDQLGQYLIDLGHRIAVLAVDPTSARTGGSILGDKTRMAGLASNPDAFIRPSPSSGALGGVSRKTREAIALCEAAGYDIVIVETVGVGQSETAVAGMVDTFLVLLLPGGGDDLQGLKKGVLEEADIIAVNKADGDSLPIARRTAADYVAALNILSQRHPDWRPPVMTVSGLTRAGIEPLWHAIERHRAVMMQSGAFETRREEQRVRWMRDLIEARLLAEIHERKQVGARLAELEPMVRRGEVAPPLAADEICRLLGLSGA